MTGPLHIDDLEPAPYNPRDMSDTARSGLGESMGRFGDLSGITYNSTTGRLVCGHQRVQELRAKGGQIVNGAIQVASGDRYPVRVVEWDEATEKAANVSANNPNIAGVYTDDLQPLLAELRGSLGDDSFGELGLDDLVLQVPDFPEVDPDDVPDTTAPKTITCPRCGHDFEG